MPRKLNISDQRRTFLRFLAASPVVGALSGMNFAGASEDFGEQVSTATDAINIFDLKATARATLPAAHYGYLATGTNGDATLKANRNAFDKYYLRSRRLVDVSKIDTSLELLGHNWSSPIVMCPVSSQRAFHSDGELGSARAAQSRNILQILSSMSSTSVEDVAQERGDPIWYQLYPTGRLDITKRLLRRAEGAGCPAVVFTVDLPARAAARHTLERAIRSDERDCAVCHENPAIAGKPKPM